MRIYSGSRQDLPLDVWQRLGRYRYQVFVRHLGWQLPSVAGCIPGLEYDQFDRPDTVYVVAMCNNSRSIIGCARLLPTLKPYLLSEVFPQLLGEVQPPVRGDLWELSRFAAVDPVTLSALGKKPVRCQGHLSSPHALALIRASQVCAAKLGARELITASPVAIGRLLRHNGITASRPGPVCRVGGEALCAYRIPAMLTAPVAEDREPAL